MPAVRLADRTHANTPFAEEQRSNDPSHGHQPCIGPLEAPLFIRGHTSRNEPLITRLNEAHEREHRQAKPKLQTGCGGTVDEEPDCARGQARIQRPSLAKTPDERPDNERLDHDDAARCPRP